MAKKSPDATCPLWMLTFGDCMSLLLTFFVMLMTFSTFNTSQLMDVMAGIQGALGSTDPIILRKEEDLSQIKEVPDPATGGKYTTLNKKNQFVEPDQTTPVSLQDMTLRNRFNEVRQRLEQLGFKNRITIAEVDEGIMMSLDCAIAFTDKTSVKMNTIAHQAIGGFASIAYDMGNEIRVTSFYGASSMASQLHNGLGRSLAEKRTEAVGSLLISKFKIDQSRISYSAEVIMDAKPDYIQLKIIEKFGISEIKIEDLVKPRKN